MPEMKAGRKLDARLCELLEPMGAPPIQDVAALAWGIQSTSPLGFWKFFLGSDRRHPIPVSTDWGAMGKIVDVLGPDHDITMEHAPHPFPARASLFKYSTGSGRGSGDTIPHAFALAACEALEKRAEAAP